MLKGMFSDELHLSTGPWYSISKPSLNPDTRKSVSTLSYLDSYNSLSRTSTSTGVTIEFKSILQECSIPAGLPENIILRNADLNLIARWTVVYFFAPSVEWDVLVSLDFSFSLANLILHLWVPWPNFPHSFTEQRWSKWQASPYVQHPLLKCLHGSLSFLLARPLPPEKLPFWK